MHTRLDIFGSNVMFSDVFPGMPFVVGNNISLALVTEDIEVLQSAFGKLKEGGKVGMELQETFGANVTEVCRTSSVWYGSSTLVRCNSEKKALVSPEAR